MKVKFDYYEFKRTLTIIWRRLFKLGKLLEFEHEVGDRVLDDLTCKPATIIGRSYHEGRKGPSDRANNMGSVGYWVDNDYMGGGRHPWEITKL